MLKQFSYFENNAPQMRYAEYRDQKFFVGSGVVEAGCRTVIGERLNRTFADENYFERNLTRPLV